MTYVVCIYILLMKANMTFISKINVIMGNIAAHKS